MNAARTPSPHLRPAIAIVLGMHGVVLLAHLLWPGSLVQFVLSVAVPVAAAVAMAVWWLAFSGIARRDRLATAGVFVAVGVAAVALSHRSLLPLGLAIYILPMVLTLPVAWLWLTRRAFAGTRRLGTYLALALPLLPAAMIRIDGLSGSFDANISSRWSQSPEDRYLRSLGRYVAAKPSIASADASSAGDAPGDVLQQSAAPEVPLEIGPRDWPGFRGPLRNGTTAGETIRTAWPEDGLPEVWRRPVGPGWSSFAVVGDRLFTQEQRGESEAIVCLDAETGSEIWAYTYPGRFYEMASNAGPRATPTIDRGRLYALGATGKLTALDAASGELLWQTDVAADSGAAIPEWGFAASPLIIDHRTLVVMAGEPGDKVIAYDPADGTKRWAALSGGRGYSSPQAMSFGGATHVVVMDSDGALGLDPHSGEVLWRDRWSLPAAGRIVQPLQIGDSAVAIGTGYGMGTRRLKLEQTPEGWNVAEQWTSRHLKPYFNDFVVHEGYLYGFDHEIVTCVDAETGKRQWKKGRYGFGQMLLVPEQDLLVVIGEQGRLVLLPATPEKSEVEELASFEALRGKTWNHPVIARGRLYLRNAQEAVCYEIGR